MAIVAVPSSMTRVTGSSVVGPSAIQGGSACSTVSPAAVCSGGHGPERVGEHHLGGRTLRYARPGSTHAPGGHVVLDERPRAEGEAHEGLVGTQFEVAGLGVLELLQIVGEFDLARRLGVRQAQCRLRLASACGWFGCSRLWRCWTRQTSRNRWRRPSRRWQVLRQFLQTPRKRGLGRRLC